VVVQPELMNGEPWPKRLESRASIVCYVPTTECFLASILKQGMPHISAFYASTACGVTVYGKSSVADWLISKGRQTEYIEALRKTSM
jgi:hypothetical protein